MFHRLLTSIIPIISLTAISSIAIAAEVVQLNNGNIFSGKIITSDTKSVLHLNSPFTKTPIKIKEDSIRSIFFEKSDKTTKHQEQIELINGDYFPCDITSITNDAVSFHSNVAGKHVVDRDKVSKISFNTKVNKTIYTGPGDDLSAWLTTVDAWSLKDGVLTADKRSEASIQIKKLSQNYILKFSTQREPVNPYFSLCFGCSNRKADRKSDHYYIDFNSRGVTLNRSKNGKYNALASILASHEIFSEPQINVTIKVDRKNQKLALFINNKLIKTVSEAIAAPSGDIVVIKNLHSRKGLSTNISDISIQSWSGKVNDASADELESLKNHDLITDLSGNITTGDIVNLSQEKSSGLKFKAPLAKNDSEMPRSSLNILEFQHPAKAPDLADTNFSIKLSNGGRINYSHSQFIDSNMQLEHPILGSINIPKSSLVSVIATPKKAPSDKAKKAQ